MSELNIARLITAAVAVGFVCSLGVTAWGLSKLKKAISIGPFFVAVALTLVGLYALSSIVDGLANLVSSAPHPPYDSLTEQVLLGRVLGLGPMLPLRGHPLLAAPIHAACLLGLYLALIPLVWWVGQAKRLEPRGFHPRWDDIYGSSGYGREDKRTVEPRFSLWVRPLGLLCLMVLGVAFFEIFGEAPAAVAAVTQPREAALLRPGIWALCLALTVTVLLNILASKDPVHEVVKAEPPPEPPEPADAAQWLRALAQRGFEIATEPGHAAGAVAGAAGSAEALAGAAAVEELLEVLTEGKGPWAHQQEAVERVVEGAHTLMLAPPRSGKTVATQLLAVRVAIVAGKNVLFVLRDPQTARAAAEQMRAVLARTSWSRNLRCTVTGPELVQLLAQRRSPVLAFAHVEALEEILTAHRQHAYLLEHLGLVVVEDLERYSGVRGGNLHFILRRFWGVLRGLQAEPVLLASMGEPARQAERFAETLLGVDLALVSSDGAPSAAVQIFAARAPVDGDVPALALAAAEAAALSLPLCRLGFEWITASELERATAMVTRTHGAVEMVAPELAHVSLAELTGPSLSRLLATAQHLGSAAELDRPPDPDKKEDEKEDSPTAGAHLQVAIPGLDPVSRWLAEDLSRALELGRLGRMLVADPDNPHLRMRHLRAALSEGPLEEQRALRTYGAGAVAALEERGVLTRQEQVTLQGDPPHLTEGALLRLRGRSGGGGDGRPAADTVSDQPVRVVDRATETVIRQLDPTRAPLVAYPGAVMLWRGRRFVVPNERFSYAPGAEIGAELLEDNLRTYRVRSLHARVLEPQRLRPMSMGGENLRGGLVRVRVTETVAGVRRHLPDGSLDGLDTFAPIEACIHSVARVLLLGNQTTEPALRALVNLLRPCLAAVLDCGEEGLHVAGAPRLDNTIEELDEEPVLLLIDTHEGGGGYARAADWPVLREALRLAARILDRRCCGDSAGCPRCVRTVHSHQLDPLTAELDRDGAQALVQRLVSASSSSS
jgi:DEAD/DEAH box helicase/MrfA Zn-binding domain